MGNFLFNIVYYYYYYYYYYAVNQKSTLLYFCDICGFIAVIIRIGKQKP